LHSASPPFGGGDGRGGELFNFLLKYGYYDPVRGQSVISGP
jgi:hypothetical protein